MSRAEAAAPRRGRLLSTLIMATLAVCLAGVLLVAAAGLGGAWWVLRSYSAPGPHAQPVLVTAPRGASLNAIAAQLEAAGAVENGLLFRAATRLLGRDRALQAGEYDIPARASMRDIVGMMTDGDVVQYAVTIPEGSTTLAIIEILNASPVLTGEIDTPPAEGSLLPETYAVTRGESRMAVITRMAAAQDALLAELWPERADALPFDTVEEAVNLASIVDREAGGTEHDLVAGVFVNRMRKGMRLQADATIIYGITRGAPLVNEQGQRRTIRRSELNDRTNPYHTYHIDGLPPTPIAHPGRAALEAVLNPAVTTALYFVADGTGRHVFSDTLAEHEQARQRWRQIRAQRLEEQRRAAGN